MNIILYHNDADPRVLNKGTKLTQLATVDAKPFYPVNITTPVFRLEYRNTFNSVNYCYVPTFGRYYFVAAPVLESGNAMILRCDCDVLYSFRNDILNLKTICARNEYDYNEFITDDIPSSVKATTTNYIMFETTPFQIPEDENSYCYVLNTNGLVGE